MVYALNFVHFCIYIIICVCVDNDDAQYITKQIY